MWNATLAHHDGSQQYLDTRDPVQMLTVISECLRTGGSLVELTHNPTPVQDALLRLIPTN